MELSTATQQTLSTALPARPESAQAARRSLARLRDHLEPEILQRLRLLASELITNSVRHAGVEPGSEVLLDVSARGDSVRMCVTDHGRGFLPRGRNRAIDEPGGWGLVLLDQLTDRWGVVNNGGTRVWLEIDSSTAGAG